MEHLLSFFVGVLETVHCLMWINLTNIGTELLGVDGLTIISETYPSFFKKCHLRNPFKCIVSEHSASDL